MTVDATGTAVVVGAGVAGLLAAHVLASRFEQVTLVERDALAEDTAPAFRAGVPQSRHVHVLWSRGLATMDALMPGVASELEAAGGELLNAPEEMRWLSPADWFSDVSGAQSMSASREMLEATLRRRVANRPGITLMSRQEVTGFVPGQDGQSVGGVRLRERGKDGQESVLHADLVVIAAGRSSRTADWLLQLGYPAPTTDQLDAHLGYSSRYFRRPAAEPGWKAMYVQGTPELPRGGVILPIDGGRWLVTLIGQGEHQPPVDEEEWLAFASSLRSDELSKALTEAEPLSDPVAYRSTANEWRHFERMKRWPRGLLVVGDALCQFNPVYGHGMTVAALQAQAIADQLAARGPEQVAANARKVQKAVAKCPRAAWAIATGEDSRYPGTDAPAPGWFGRKQQDYMAKVLAAANTDPVVAERFFAVISLNRRPEALLTPQIMARAWRHRT